MSKISKVAVREPLVSPLLATMFFTLLIAAALFAKW